LSSILNFVAPLATIPLVFHFFSTTLYSKSIFYFSIINLVLFLLNFGYNSGAIQLIKSQKGQTDKRGLFLELFQIKILLIFISIVVLYFCSLFQSDSNLYFLLCSVWLLLNELFNQLWIFQSFNSFKYFLFINIANKSLTIIFLSFLFFVDNRDAIYFPIILSVPYLITSLFAATFILKRLKGEKLFFNKIRLSTLKVLFHIHLGNLGSFSYQQLTRVLVGTYLPADKIIIFDLSDKLFNVLKAPLGAISNSEGIKKIASRSKSEIKSYWNKLLKVQVLIILVLLSVTFSLSGFQISYKGINVVEIFYCLAGLSISLPFVAASNTFGVLFTPVYGGLKKFNFSIFIGGILFLLISTLLIKTNYFSLNTLTMALLIVEAYIGINSFLNSNKYLNEL
jgi:O-antigen/teichoic acid export membrane protein